MSLTAITFPTPITGALDPVVFTFQTPSTDVGVNATTRFRYDSYEEIRGARYIIHWLEGAYSETLDCVDGAIENGREFDPTAGVPFAEWLLLVKHSFSFNKNISDFFVFRDVPAERSFYLDAIHNGTEYCAECEVTNGNCVIEKNAGVAAILLENLKLGISVYQGVEVINLFEQVLSPIIANGFAQATFEIGELLQPALKSEFTLAPVTGLIPVKHNEMNLPYHIVYYRIFGSSPSIEHLYHSKWFFSFNGGIPPEKKVSFFASYHNLAAYFDAGNIFLTWCNFPKRTDIHSPERLFFVVHKAHTENILVKCTTHFIDDGDTIIYKDTEIVPIPGEVYELDTCIQSILMDVPENLYGYDIQLCDGDEDAISTIFQYVIDFQVPPNIKYFMFRNSFGAFECERFYGESVRSFSFERIFIEESSLINSADLLPIKGQLHPKVVRSFKVSTGFRTKNEISYLYELLKSPEVYLISDGVKMPVAITQDKIDLLKDDTYLYSLSIEMQFINMDRVFSSDESNVWEEVEEGLPPYQEI